MARGALVGAFFGMFPIVVGCRPGAVELSQPDLAVAASVPAAPEGAPSASSEAADLLKQSDATCDQVRTLRGHLIDARLSLPRKTAERPNPPPFDSAHLTSWYLIAAPDRLAVDETRHSFHYGGASRPKREFGYVVGGRGRRWDLPPASDPDAQPNAPSLVSYRAETSLALFQTPASLRGPLQFDAGLGRTLDLRDHLDKLGWRDLGEETLGSLRCRHLARAEVTGAGGECRHYLTNHLWLAPEFGMRRVKWEDTNGSPDNPAQRVVVRHVGVVDRLEQVDGVWMPVLVREAEYGFSEGQARCGMVRAILATGLHVNEAAPERAFDPEDPSQGLQPFFGSAERTAAEAAVSRLQADLEAGRIPPELRG
jgi:hypothetical protein